MSVGPLAEKFNMVSSDYGCTHKCDFSVSDQKYPFWTNLVQNIKIVSLSWTLVPRLIRIRRIQWWCLIFPFLTGNIFLDKLGLKNQNYQFKLKFGTYTNSNMQNSMVIFTFVCFWPEFSFLGKFGLKNKNCWFKLKFVT